MGNTNKHVKESTFRTTHPNLNKAKVIEDEHRKYIQAVFKAQSREYEDWQQSLKLANCSPDHFLLLPEKSTYKEDKGLCGNTGTLTVRHVLPRINTLATLTSSPNSSSNAWAKENSSRSRNCGTPSSR